MSYAIIRNAKYKMANLQSISRHNERQNEKYGNKDIDQSRSDLNYHLKVPKENSYELEFERLRKENDLKGNLRLSGKKQSNVVDEFLITSDNDFFKNIGAEETKRYFKSAYDFACSKCGEKNIISAVVHMDETTPHMHLTYIPVVKGLKKGEEVLKINSSEFWKGFNSYGKLQDDFHSYVKERGFDLDRGETKEEKREHLTVEEFKAETKKAELQKEVETLNGKIEAVEGVLSEVSIFDNVKLDKLKIPLLKGKFAISESDYEKVIAWGKVGRGYLIENSSLKSENNKLKNKVDEIVKEEIKRAEIGFKLQIEKITKEYNTKVSKAQREYEAETSHLTRSYSKTIEEKNLEISRLKKNSDLSKDDKTLKIEQLESQISTLKEYNEYFHSENMAKDSKVRKLSKANKKLETDLEVVNKALNKLDIDIQKAFKEALEKEIKAIERASRGIER